MKKSKRQILFAGILVVILTLALSGVAFAVEGQAGKADAQTAAACAKTCKVNFVDTNGDGICDYQGNGNCPGYVDANGDGICDNFGNSVCNGLGMSQGQCQNQGSGCGMRATRSQ
jgi:hypothetical protein